MSVHHGFGFRHDAEVNIWSENDVAEVVHFADASEVSESNSFAISRNVDLVELQCSKHESFFLESLNDLQ